MPLPDLPAFCSIFRLDGLRGFGNRSYRTKCALNPIPTVTYIILVSGAICVNLARPQGFSVVSDQAPRAELAASPPGRGPSRRAA